jgi:pSer/pThr/pTyr-binding forkhead associated (FHA) protein
MKGYAMPEIIVKYDDKVVERFVTEKKRISVGRTNDNDIVLENRGVSRKHALIEFNNNAAVVIDNESLNGTFVNSRKISEELLRENDSITIGKYTLVFKSEEDGEAEDPSGFDGTMVLNTKKHREMVANDQMEREIVSRYGCSVLVGMENSGFEEVELEREVTTIGKAKFVHVPARGFWMSGIQAKIVREEGTHFLVNLGKPGKTKVNGEAIDRHELKNGDLITVGKSTFKYLQGQ